ncbi:zinc finger protein 701-like isoform X4 [Schistocerca gregaria]|uniref:zinc finger protein 701-like isoform X4 n=1 Tax=Schistocerca gregaria TaxID=7010 RepID=UPI00211F416A|nr:zinc finger protein 701-like isoform X4 [Schistocerca gregaria]
MEMVETDPLVSVKQEIEYVCVEQESPDVQQWEVPNDWNDVQDPLSIDKEECPSSEDHLMSSTFNIVKTEYEDDEGHTGRNDGGEDYSSENFIRCSTFNIEKTEGKEDEEAVREDHMEELKHEVESTSSGSEPKSTVSIGAEDDKSNDDSSCLVTNISLAAGTGNREQCTTTEEACCGNKSGIMPMGHGCTICKKTFAQLQEMREHTHVDRRERLRSCSVCNKTFTTGANLKRHFRVHTGERPFSCSVCNKTFIQNGDLKKHSWLHTGERPFSCGVCNKTFVQNSDLKKHSRLHTGERPYNCEFCHKRFRNMSNLREHSRVHTGVKPYNCNICQKKFSYESNLRKHLLLHMRKCPNT